MRRWSAFVIIASIMSGWLAAGQALSQSKSHNRRIVKTFHFSSPAFGDSTTIPARYTCDGENMSPALQWEGVPANAKSLALVCDDPDAPAGTWVHWVIYNISATIKHFDEGIAPTETLSLGAIQGTNDFKKIGYGGPCPPRGKAHHYHFTMYALDCTLALKPGLSKDGLFDAMRSHILAEGHFVGLYRKK